MMFVIKIIMLVWDNPPIARFCAGLLHTVKIIGSNEAITKIEEYTCKIFTTGYNNNFTFINQYFELDSIICGLIKAFLSKAFFFSALLHIYL